MTRSELIAKIAEKNPHLTIDDVERVVMTIFNEITKTLSNGDRVELRGFGTFSVKARKGYEGRNPRTGETVKVAAKYVPTFKVGKPLREALAQQIKG